MGEGSPTASARRCGIGAWAGQRAGRLGGPGSEWAGYVTQSEPTPGRPGREGPNVASRSFKEQGLWTSEMDQAQQRLLGQAAR
jgi:hypothetical protein